jgi:type II secretory ATPase GspE/PulE/Tfp pilus assembly ATPase PilB-like protein
MTPSRKEHARFWDSVAASLAAGRRLTDALETAGIDTRDAGFRMTVTGLVKGLEQGMPLSLVLCGFPHVFEAQVVDAVRAGEQAGKLDVVAPLIAEALRADDLGPLAVSVAAAMDVSRAPERPAVEEPPVIAVAPPSNPGNPGNPGHSGNPGNPGRTDEMIDALFAKAAETGASDIHIDPLPDGGGVVRLRIDGTLLSQDPPPEGATAKMVARLKVRAGMDCAETRLPQDARILLDHEGRRLDLRIAVAPTVHGERAVLRILDPERVRLTLDDIYPDDENAEALKSLARLPHGLVIVNGPTGCGKTTTLYGMGAEINEPGRSIVSIEDPVEYVLPGVAQMQVAPRIGFTFAKAQRIALRQDPDVLLLGEIRDEEQLHLAVQAAMTGHLVLSTLHARTSPEAVVRLTDIGLEPFLVNASLKAVVSQSLVRRLCPECRVPVDLDETLLPPDVLAFARSLEGARFHAARGCDACRGGYRGRAAINEILRMDGDVRRVVAAGSDEAAVREAARKAGMRSFLEDGLLKASRGVTTVEEVVRVAPLPPDRK